MNFEIGDTVRCINNNYWLDRKSPSFFDALEEGKKYEVVGVEAKHGAVYLNLEGVTMPYLAGRFEKVDSFSVGDKVICVNARYSNGKPLERNYGLVEGQVYTVEKVDSFSVKVEGSSVHWLPERFKKKILFTHKDFLAASKTLKIKVIDTDHGCQITATAKIRGQDCYDSYFTPSPKDLIDTMMDFISCDSLWYMYDDMINGSSTRTRWYEKE